MDYPDKQFEGWTPDDFASYAFSPHRYSFFAGGVFLVSTIAMYAVGNLGVLRWIAPSAAPLWHRWSIAVLFGMSEEAIARQEITYARIGQAQDRLAHAMTRKRPRRTAMKQKR